MLQQLKYEVWRANMLLPKYKLITFTWGNVSGIDRESGLFVIKPSGVDYDELSPDDLPVCDLNGNVVEGSLKPSSDTPTHAALYRAFPEIGGITHTHSPWATVFSQAGRPIKPYGTTHADYFDGCIPCTRKMMRTEIASEYEKNTGEVIIETLSGDGSDDKNSGGIGYKKMHAVLVNSHGPFTWGENAAKSVETAVVLEEVAMMAYHTELLAATPQNGATRMSEDLLRKHFDRKHGANAYYGQDKK